MELTRPVVEERAEEYAAEEPLFAVESEQLEGLPDAFASGNFGWRDAEWVVRWHYRRYLGEYPDAERRAGEDAFGENDYEDVRDALEAAGRADGVAATLAPLVDLDGVDVPVASAFLHFLAPERFVVVGAPEWSVLEAAGDLSRPYPDPPSPGDYETYVEACRAVADRTDRPLVAVHRALWRLSTVE